MQPEHVPSAALADRTEPVDPRSVTTAAADDDGDSLLRLGGWSGLPASESVPMQAGWGAIDA